MSTLLETRGLDVAIAGKPVCRKLTLRIETSERWAILGPNGSGKTTLLHTLAGLRSAEGGEIFVGDKSLSSWPARALARELGTLLQTHDDPFPGTVLDTVLIGRHPHLARWRWEGDDDRRRAAAALAAVDMAGFDSRLIATLSGGERRRVAIAAVLCQDPKLFVLDEPTNHLDLHHQVRVLTLFDRLARIDGRGVLMVLHDITSAARYCDHVVLLYGNGESEAGPAAELLTEKKLERLYGHRLHRLHGPDGDIWVPAMDP